MIAFISGTIRWTFRMILLIVSLCSGILGAHGIYAYIFRANIITGVNGDRIFLAWHVPVGSISKIIEEVTIRSIESITLPIVLVAVGLITWVTQSRMTRRSFYRRVRFASPSRVSPIAWFLVIAGIAATAYIIVNWEAMDKGIATLVITANLISILWNLSIFRR
jgi:uncharacterized membrane protein YidH (DUF202 family)